jgi:flavin reductase (DIM6/NTAB) family NADH-FMN oxidoreductase RutF
MYGLCMKKTLKPSTSVVPCPVVLLSVSDGTQSNIITLSWVANACSDPPSVVVVIRPNRHSHRLVQNAGNFVLNIPSANLFEAVKFCGSKSGRDYDKFKECGLTAAPSTKISSPLIVECPVNLECEIKQMLPIGVHDLFIAEVVAVHMNDEVLTEKGRPAIERMNLFTYLPINGEYWNLGQKM